MGSRRYWIAAVGVALLLGTARPSGAVLVGAEFQVNTYTVSGSFIPSMASDAAGNFVVIWNDEYTDGSYSNTRGQRYASSGAALGTEFQVNTYTIGYQSSGSVAMDPIGNFVVAWTSNDDVATQDGSYDGVFAQRYDSAGALVGTEFQVNTTTLGYQGSPDIAVAPNGNFVVVWGTFYGTYGPDGHLGGITAQRFASNGQKVGSEFQVNSYTIDRQSGAKIAMAADGKFVVVWNSTGQDGSNVGGFGQRYDSAGTPLGSEFQVAIFTANGQVAESIAAEPDGDFVVITRTPDGSFTGVFGRRFSSAGLPLSGDFLVNTQTGNTQDRGAVIVAGNGDFLVTWTSNNQDGNSGGIFGQFYGSDGVPRGPEFQVNTYVVSNQWASANASLGNGRFVVAWTSGTQDGYGFGIFGQRLQAPITPDDFTCYKAKDLKDPEFPGAIVSLADQFETKFTDVKKPYFFCNPTSTNSAPIDNPLDHLACYKIKDIPPQAPFPGAKVQVTNVFGTGQLELKKPYLLCAPSSKTVLP